MPSFAMSLIIDFFRISPAEMKIKLRAVDNPKFSKQGYLKQDVFCFFQVQGIYNST